jgi:hypothetical protein
VFDWGLAFPSPYLAPTENPFEIYLDKLSAGAPKFKPESTSSPCRFIKSAPTAIAHGFSLV